MHGMMMNRPLRIADIITLAEKIHPNEEIISKTLQGELHTTDYAEIALRSRRMSRALLSLGVKMGDRIATLAWNGFRHLELYFAISGIGAICHTINPPTSISSRPSGFFPPRSAISSSNPIQTVGTPHAELTEYFSSKS